MKFIERKEIVITWRNRSPEPTHTGFPAEQDHFTRFRVTLEESLPNREGKVKHLVRRTKMSKPAYIAGQGTHSLPDQWFSMEDCRTTQRFDDEEAAREAYDSHQDAVVSRFGQ